MGKAEKNGKKIAQLKLTQPKYQKPKDKNMGWMKRLSDINFIAEFLCYLKRIFSKTQLLGSEVV